MPWPMRRMVVAARRAVSSVRSESMMARRRARAGACESVVRKAARSRAMALMLAMSSFTSGRLYHCARRATDMRWFLQTSDRWS